MNLDKILYGGLSNPNIPDFTNPVHECDIEVLSGWLRIRDNTRGELYED